MADPGLTATGIEKRLRRRPILKGIDLRLERGEVLGLSGENGSGKTTLMRILAGLLRPDRGAIRHSGSLGYAPQDPLLYDLLTVWEHFRYVATARGVAERCWAPIAGGLLERYRFGNWREHRAGSLSGGTRQKLNLALALLSRPDVLLLDEPYGGFEWDTYLRFWEHVAELRAEGQAVLVVSHFFFDRKGFDRVLVLRAGHLEPAG